MLVMLARKDGEGKETSVPRRRNHKVASGT